LRIVTRPVGVLDPQDELTTLLAGEGEIEERLVGGADVREAGRRRRDAHTNSHCSRICDRPRPTGRVGKIPPPPYLPPPPPPPPTRGAGGVDRPGLRFPGATFLSFLPSNGPGNPEGRKPRSARPTIASPRVEHPGAFSLYLSPMAGLDDAAIEPIARAMIEIST